jgi:hypothetical protein
MNAKDFSLSYAMAQIKSKHLKYGSQVKAYIVKCFIFLC